MILEKEQTKYDLSKVEPLLVVRLITTYYQDKKGDFITSKKLKFLKRKCQGFDFFSEDVSMAGIDSTMNHIENLYDCEDGIYQLIVCNVYKDWDTGCIEDWDYKLIPYKEEN